MRVEGVKSDSPAAKPQVIPEVEYLQKSDIIMEKNGPHKYNTRSSTKIVSHVTTFKTAPNMFKAEEAEK